MEYASHVQYVCFLFIQTFQKDEKLREFFQIVSTNKDKKGKTFISTMEGNSYLKNHSVYKILNEVCVLNN